MKHVSFESGRIRTIFLCIALLYGGVMIRLFYWQIVQGANLRLQAQEQYEEHQSIPAKRGEIFASDGVSPLVVNTPSYLLFAEPHRIEDPRSFSRQIAPIIQMKPEEVENLIDDKKKHWVALGNNIDIQKKQEIEKTHVIGFGFDQHYSRMYPEASMAAHLLGFVGQDVDGKQKGYFGIEGYYDRELSGKEGSVYREKDARGNPMLVSDETTLAAQNGRTLILWLDRTMQYIAEKRLKEGIEKYGAREGIAVIMDPATGGILASATYPNYDPTIYAQFNNADYKNPLIAKSYEPGSTFKPLIMAAAVNEGLIHADTIMHETGPVKIGEYSVKTWNESYHGVITMTQVLQYSSNVGMVFVGDTLGNERLIRYIKNYGFGEKTNVDLEEESSPDLRPDLQWGPIDYATASFGQGIAVTPLQLLRAIASIASDGWLMEPKIVKEMKSDDGKIIPVKPKKLRQVISSQTAKELTRMMVDAVSYGEAKWAKPKGYSVAGKTGTAQIPVEGHYDKDKTIASFVGFAPADKPKFIMLVALTEPKTSIWGSETAAPLYFVIAKDFFAYLGIAPTN